MKTIRYGSQEVKVLERIWEASPRKPYRKTYKLKPGQQWEEAEETEKQWETYVTTANGSYEPVGARVAQELIEEGAESAGFIEMWCSLVYVNHKLVCEEISGKLEDVLKTVKEANGGSLAGFPDVVGFFEDGRIVMREVKNLDSKDRLGPKQHALADVMLALFGDKLQLQVLEWRS